MSLCILVLTLDFQMPTYANIIIGVGVAWAVVTTVVGAVAVGSPDVNHRRVGGGIAKDEAKSDRRCLFDGFQVFKESRVLVWIFWALSLPQVAFFVYVIYAVSCITNT